MDLWNQSILSFSAGLLSSITPKALPLVFIVAAYASFVWALHGLSDDQDESVRAIVVQVLFMAAAFFTLSLLLGLPASAIGEYFIRTQSGFRLAAGGLMMAFGLSHLMSGKSWLASKANTISKRPMRHLVPVSIILGLGLAAWWRPDAGMVLTTITLYAATIDGQIQGLVFMAAHQAGFTLIFLMVGLTVWSVFGAWLVDARPTMFWIRLTGLVMIVFGAALFLNQLHWLAPQGRAAFVV